MQNIEKFSIEGSVVTFHSLIEERRYRLSEYESYLKKSLAVWHSNCTEWIIENVIEELESLGLLNSMNEVFTNHIFGLIYFKGKAKLRYKSMAVGGDTGLYKNSKTEQWEYRRYNIEFDNDLAGSYLWFTKKPKFEEEKEYEFEYIVTSKMNKRGEWFDQKSFRIIYPKKAKKAKNILREVT